MRETGASCHMGSCQKGYITVQKPSSIRILWVYSVLQNPSYFCYSCWVKKVCLFFLFFVTSLYLFVLCHLLITIYIGQNNSLIIFFERSLLTFWPFHNLLLFKICWKVYYHNVPSVTVKKNKKPCKSFSGRKSVNSILSPLFCCRWNMYVYIYVNVCICLCI